jgi:hypothetical protein
MIKKLLFILAFMELSLVSAAQQSPFGQTFEQMHRMMLKGMLGDTTIALRLGESHRFPMGPDSSSFFYFRVDTTFQGGAMHDFFRMDPFNDRLGEGGADDFWGFGRMMREMQEMQRQMLGISPEQAPDSGEEEILPEERIRKQEEGSEKSNKPPVSAPAPTKIKTIRI